MDSVAPFDDARKKIKKKKKKRTLFVMRDCSRQVQGARRYEVLFGRTEGSNCEGHLSSEIGAQKPT